MNELDDYLRANRDAFTREALTRRLIDEGHDPADVEAAWARIGAGPINQWAASDGPVSAPRGRAGIGTFLLIIAVVLGYGYVTFLGLAGIVVSAAYGPSGGAQSGGHPAATILALVYGIAMVIGLGYSVRRLYRAPSIRTGGSVIGAAFGISVVVLLGISGVCVVGVLASNALGGL